ncbi:MAG TPA: preprotein translocase subunit YajC [Motilibacterales bacterium]|nr:preprotein translocase subunit YajC [Motilibacterales bacterium]
MTLVELLPFVAIAAAFWLLIIRPSSTRRKAQAALVASLAPGQRIMTTAGVFGTVAAIEGDRVIVEIAPGVVIEMLALAVGQVVPTEDTQAATTQAVGSGADADAGIGLADEPDVDSTREADRG